MFEISYLYFSGLRGLFIPLFNFAFQNFDVEYRFQNTIVRTLSSLEQRFPITNTSTLYFSFSSIIENYTAKYIQTLLSYTNLSLLLPYLPETFSLVQTATPSHFILHPDIQVANFFELLRRSLLIYYNPKTKESTVLEISSINTQNNTIILGKPPEIYLIRKVGLLAPAIPCFVENIQIEKINLYHSVLQVQALEITTPQNIWL